MRREKERENMSQIPTSNECSIMREEMMEEIEQNEDDEEMNKKKMDGPSVNLIDPNEYFEMAKRYIDNGKILKKKNFQIKKIQIKINGYVSQKRELRLKLLNYKREMEKIQNEITYLENICKEKINIPMENDLNKLFSLIVQYNKIIKKQNETKYNIYRIKKIWQKNKINIETLDFLLQHYKTENQLLENTFINVNELVKDEDDNDIFGADTNNEDEEDDDDDNDDNDNEDEKNCNEDADKNDKKTERTDSTSLLNSSVIHKNTPSSIDSSSQLSIPMDIYHWIFMLIAHFCKYHQNDSIGIFNVKNISEFGYPKNSSSLTAEDKMLENLSLFFADIDFFSSSVASIIEHKNKINEKIFTPLKLFWNKEIEKTSQPLIIYNKQQSINSSSSSSSSSSSKESHSFSSSSQSLKEWINYIFKHVMKNFSKYEIIEMLMLGELLLLKTHFRYLESLSGADITKKVELMNTLDKYRKQNSTTEDDQILLNEFKFSLQTFIDNSELTYSRMQISLRTKFDNTILKSRISPPPVDDSFSSSTIPAFIHSSSTHFPSSSSYSSSSSFETSNTSSPPSKFNLSWSSLQDLVAMTLPSSSSQESIEPLLNTLMKQIKKEISIIKVTLGNGDDHHQITARNGSIHLCPFISIILLFI